MLIGGDWLSDGTDGTFEDRDPATGEVNAVLPSASPRDVERAIAAARAAQPGWARLAAAERGRLLVALAERLEGEREHISRLESADNGRPRRETAAQAGIVAKWFRYFGGMADKVEGSVIPVEGPYLNYTRRVPVGVCAAITPWNHPMLIAAKKVAPALACGNAVVLKPSELAPLSVLELGRLAGEAGLPPGVLNVVPGGPDAGRALVSSPDVDRIDLTGSTATGMAIAAEAAGTLKRVGLELGGKAANLVFADADLRRTAAGAVFSGYIAQGQSCVAGARVLVHESIAAELAEAMRDLLAGLRIGDPLDDGTQMGPLITPDSARRVAGYVDGALDEGARLLTGGGRPDGLPEPLAPDGYYEPTLLWTDDATIVAAREEIFGPVVTVTPFRDEGEAIEIANSVPFGLGAGIWTGDVARAHRVAEALRAGVIWVNDYHRIDPASPWGGFGLSGYGRENGFAAIAEFTDVKSVWVGIEDRPMDWYERGDAGGRLN